MTQQAVGFVRRSTPLLIIGQQGCRLCGYKNIEEQDCENSMRAVNSECRKPNAKDMTCEPMYRSMPTTKAKYNDKLHTASDPSAIPTSHIMDACGNVEECTTPTAKPEQHVIPDGKAYVGCEAHKTHGVVIVCIMSSDAIIDNNVSGSSASRLNENSRHCS